MDSSHYDMLEKAFFGSRYEVDDETPVRVSSLTKSKRLSRPVPTTQATIPSDDGSSPRASPARREEKILHTWNSLSLLQSPAVAVKTNTPPAHSRPISGLPPTPPTLTSSEIVESRLDQNVSPTPQFADAVRNALHSQKSGLSTPGLRPPHTPVPSPPGTSGDLSGSTLHPPEAHYRPSLRDYPSSRADSFKTARENQSSSQLPLTPSPQPSPDMWLTSPRPMRLQDIQSSTIHGDQPSTPEMKEHIFMDSTPVTPEKRRFKSRVNSPTRSVHSEGDFEKHISYLGPDESVDPYLEVENDPPRVHEPAVSRWLVPLQQSNGEQSSAEDVNNMVYKHIQEQNIKRNSLLNTVNAMPVGIIPLTQNTERKLKRTAKRQTLREDASSDSPCTSHEEHSRLRHTKAQLPKRSLEASPIVEPRVPALRATHAHASHDEPLAMTRITHAEMLAAKEHLTSVESEYSPSVGRQHTLRRTSKGDRIERKAPLSPTSQHSSTSPQATPDLHFPIRSKAPNLRHFSNEARLENNRHARRTSLDSPAVLHPTSSESRHSAERKLRHYPRDAKLENNNSVRRTSLEHSPTMPTSPWLSPGRKSVDARFLHSSLTPLSQSQLSDRSEMEVCEAQGVNIYPHNNDSLLVVQHGSRPTSKDEVSPTPNNLLGITNEQLGFGQTVFSSELMEPHQSGTTPTIHVDSPLTNPRAAPEPPALIQIIPPTPSEELDRELGAEDAEYVLGKDGMPRRPSLMQRARRYSESFVQPLFGRNGSVRRQQRRATMDDSRPQNLSPLWKPRYFWEDMDSDEEEYDDEPHLALPRGGDTSDVPDRRLWVPRNMSVRMPGFRGKGGFLVGNSLGLDRHGTNSRRHYVVRRRASEEMLRQVAWGRGSFVIPFSGGKRVSYVGVQGLRRRMSEIRSSREEREREGRREALRGKIQHGKQGVMPTTYNKT